MANDKRGARARRLAAADWIDAASVAIVEGGVGAVAVEPLAQRLGVTKGSFYWHFANRDALLQAALARWEQEGTEAIIAELDQIADPRHRLETLITGAFAGLPPVAGVPASEIVTNHAFDLAVADAADDPIAGPVLRRVSERRVDYLDDCFRALGYPPHEARYRALLGYAAFVGTLRLVREAPSRLPQGGESRAYQQHVIATIMPTDEGDGIKRDRPLPAADPSGAGRRGESHTPGP
jgi:AcrR family transcriptional regulator